MPRDQPGRLDDQGHEEKAERESSQMSTIQPAPLQPSQAQATQSAADGTVKCPNQACGKDNLKGNKYCGNCGRSLDPELNQIVQAAVAAEVRGALESLV